MNSTTTKRALFSSVVALLLCFTMLLGTTFAWFTDTATSAVNTIQAGTLDIALVDATGASLEGQTLGWVAADSRSQDNILWEPGCTYNTQAFYLKNNGNLALKYEIAINGITGDAKLLEVIEWTITVGGVETVLEDLKGELLANETTGAIVISGHMKEEAGNEYQGLKIEDVSISVVATQHTYENDSFGNDYDANATYPVLVSTAAELKDALTNGGNVVLATNIDLDVNESIVIPTGVEATLDLNGHTLSAENTNTSTHNFMIDVKGGTLNISNGTVAMKHTGANMGWNGATTVIDVTAGGVLNLDGVTVKNEGGTDMNFGVHLNNWGEVTLNADNCVFDSSYCGVRVFNSGFDMNNVKITNSTLKGATRAFWVHNYIGDLDSSKHSDDAIKARLNLDIYDNNLTIYNLDVLLPRFGTSLLFHVPF